jgi:hypothetical protein
MVSIFKGVDYNVVIFLLLLVNFIDYPVDLLLVDGSSY